MRAMTYLFLGIAGTIAYQKISENKPMLRREFNRMMRHNNRSIQKIREIF